MNKIASDFRNKGVVFYVLYTREPHAGQDMTRGFGMDFSAIGQTRSRQERVDYAKGMVKEFNEHRPILVDTFGENCLQRTLGGGRPNSLIVVDKEGRVALWQDWGNPAELRRRLEDMTGAKSSAASGSPRNSARPAGEKDTAPAKSGR